MQTTKVFRCYTEKKTGYDAEAKSLLAELTGFVSVKNLESVRVLNRYDVSGINDEAYVRARGTIFADPVCDNIYDNIFDFPSGSRVLAAELMPGQFDPRADGLAQCLQVMTGGMADHGPLRPTARFARVYILGGKLSDGDFSKIKKYLINTVDSREASPDIPLTLDCDIPAPDPVPILTGFISLDRDGLLKFIDEYSLAMDIADIEFFQCYFRNDESRDPTETELRAVDTYWSDHCRHSTFLTHLTDISIEDEEIDRAFERYMAARREVYGDKEGQRPVTLMDVATMGMKLLKKRGQLSGLDESGEVNACTVRIKAKVDGKDEDYLLLFKNETHNRPTEIAPFGGASTCLGGAIRDPMSGRAYVYQAMRVTGCADPRRPYNETMPGKLSQRQITTIAAEGNSSYGNQIGVAAGLAGEIYHPGYIAKRMELGALVGAVKYADVRRETPAPGDVVILVGGRTGRDGCGSATSSSKVDNDDLAESASSGEPKGNPPEERKIVRLFRDPEAALLIKRCNDFGAGGVSVAVGELADGLDIDLSAVKTKYDGLTGTEIAISESQERMAVVVEAKDAASFIQMAEAENLEATVIATVTDKNRLVMKLDGRVILDISRSFLNSNGATKKAAAAINAVPPLDAVVPAGGDPVTMLKNLLSDLNFCSQRGIAEKFDSSAGAASVLAPFGGEKGRTPSQVMAAKLPVLSGEMATASVMAYGYEPFLFCHSPFAGAACAVTESLAKLVAAGCRVEDAYLSFQEYFEDLRSAPQRWGKPLGALLGALEAQIGLGVASIGGKDSMSGSYNDIDVPPTLVSFAVATAGAAMICSPDFKRAGSPVYLFAAPKSRGGIPAFESVRAMWQNVHKLHADGSILSAWALSAGGAIEGIYKMCAGSGLGFAAAPGVDDRGLFGQDYGAIMVETDRPVTGAVLLGHTTDDGCITFADRASVDMAELNELWEQPLEGIFPTLTADKGAVDKITCASRDYSAPGVKTVRPRVLIPVFPGANGEYDTARAFEQAGAETETLVIRNMTPSALAESFGALRAALGQANILAIPGGFSAGGEPDGAGKLIAAFLRDPRISEGINELLNLRDGLILGICDGFQALIRLGLVPYGEIRPGSADGPALARNTLGFRSRYVFTRVASVKSPWMSLYQPGEVHVLPVACAEGRFTAPAGLLDSLIAGGQIATQYCDRDGNPSMDISVNPSGATMAIEGVFSPDGRVFGKMAHNERMGANVAKNIYGPREDKLFRAGVGYFK